MFSPVKYGRHLALPMMLALAVSGCGKQETGKESSDQGPKQVEVAPPAGGVAPSAAALAEAQQVFATRCTPCHGAAGGGDGAASAALSPKPRNFQDPEWQKAVTDDHIEKIIQYGGAAVGRSPAMPGNPDLGSKPELVAALRAHIRSLKK